MSRRREGKGRRALLSGRSRALKARLSDDGAVKADRGWKRSFVDPILVPRGRQLVALKDATDFITRLPMAEHESPPWQTAIEASIMATILSAVGRRCAHRRHRPDMLQGTKAVR